MANTYASTVLQNARIKLMEDSEMMFGRRPKLTQIRTAFLEGQGYIRGVNGESLDELRQATTQTTQILYKNPKDFTIGTSKSCSPSGETGSSSALSVTWSTINATIKHQRKKYFGNEIKAAEGLAYDIAEAEKSLWLGASGVDAKMYAYLDANRTQINAISSVGGSKNSWVTAGSAYYVQVANADINRFYNYLMGDMAINNYVGEMYDIHNVGWMSEVAHYAEQGTANSTNTAYQFDGIKRLPSNLITPAGYFESTHYVVSKGGVACMFWNDQLNRTGHGGEGNDRYYTVMESNIVPGVYYDVFITESCADTSDDGGSTQDLVLNIEMSLNYSLVKQPVYNASGTETPIFKYNVALAS